MRNLSPRLQIRCNTPPPSMRGDRNFGRVGDGNDTAVVNDETQLFSVAQALAGTSHGGVEFEVVKLKNRFKEPLYNGYRDALYSVRVRIPGTDAWHVCEMQARRNARAMCDDSSDKPETPAPSPRFSRCPLVAPRGNLRAQEGDARAV